MNENKNNIEKHNIYSVFWFCICCILLLILIFNIFVMNDHNYINYNNLSKESQLISLADRLEYNCGSAFLTHESNKKEWKIYTEKCLKSDDGGNDYCRGVYKSLEECLE